MSKDIKKLSFCKITEAVIDKQVKTYTKLVSNPKYICDKCYRLANKKRNLCHPEQIKNISLN